MRLLISIVFVFLSSMSLFSQAHCASVQLMLENEGNNMFVFDDFSSYEAGVARTTIARLKVKVDDKAISDGLCSWNLGLTVDNNGSASDEWEELNLYSNGLGQNPLLNILEIRAINDCQTSNQLSDFVPLEDVPNIMEIIEPVIINTVLTTDINHAGSCVKNVNGPGDYINNYHEFTFKIEVRIKPGMSYNPGRFALTLNFRLEENI